ncbi:hypothetical protein J132_02009 [Termitomyces sp. J132]|nr:hypothetical protein H2248_003726 [Termitomyces sp. 'cryptogamus']KNZ81319.1 hypothetical protein J132_02009 [Termitomyces sp. J132]
MVVFLDLPVDILPLILSFIVRPQHLASNSLVNKTFQSFAIPRLYERVSLYAWQREGKTKVVQLFSTLARCSHLAKHVRRLEIRDFPKATADDRLVCTVLQGLRNCTNLRVCTWTRDGSLTSDILEALQISGVLTDLEINGRSEGNFNPTLLQNFTRLSRLSLIMPSNPVVQLLDPWISMTGSTLQSLNVICKASPLITDTILETLAPNLYNLKNLYLTGCVKVTHKGVWAVLSHNTAGLVGLGLEGVSPQFDMGEFSRLCLKAGALKWLLAITLTVHPQCPLDTWTSDVLSLLSASPLQKFQIYSPGAFYESPWTELFWSQLVTTHGHRLYQFSVHRMLISLTAIEEICRRCTVLQQLFIVVEPDSLPSLGQCLVHAKSLRSIHVNYPVEAHTDDIAVISAMEALSVIKHCSPTLTQFGCNARVWQVTKHIEMLPDGSYAVHPRLSPYESPDIPEPFLVVRT